MSINISTVKQEQQPLYQQPAYQSMQSGSISPSKKEKEQIQDMRAKIENAKKLYQGFGKPGYLDKISSKALRSVYQQKLDNRTPRNYQDPKLLEGKQYINSSFVANGQDNEASNPNPKNKSYFTAGCQQQAGSVSELYKPEKAILKKTDTSKSGSNEINELEEDIQMVAQLPHITEIEKNRKKEKKDVGRRISKELNKLEEMFPIKYSSRQKIYSPFKTNNAKNDSSIYIESDVVKQSPSTLSQYKQQLGIVFPKVYEAPTITKYLDEDGDSSLSSQSENPNSKLSEADALYKIMRMHNDVLQNDKKRMQYLTNVGFVKGIFNDKCLHWEVHNNSTSNAANQQKLKVLTTVMPDDNKERQKNLQRFISNSVKPTNMQASKSQQSFFNQRSPSSSFLMKKEYQNQKDSFIVSTPSNANFTPRNKKSLFRKQLDHFQNQSNQLIEKCNEVATEFHQDRLRIQRSEKKIRSVLQETFSGQAKLFENREKLIEADKYSQVLAKNNLSLRNKIFRQTMDEINDQEFHEKVDKDIERFLQEGQNHNPARTIKRQDATVGLRVQTQLQ